MNTQKNLSSQEDNELERIKHLRKVRERREREERRREDNHWNYLAGALVAKHLKADLDIPIYKGKDAAAKNAAAFAPLENILRYLATHKEFTAQLAKGLYPPVHPDI